MKKLKLIIVATFSLQLNYSQNLSIESNLDGLILNIGETFQAESFISNLELIERLKVEILRSVEKTFSEYQQLWVCSEDGIDISILSTYNQIYSYDELF